MLMARMTGEDSEGELEISGLRQRIPESFSLIRDVSRFWEDLEYTPLKYLLHNILAVVNAIDRVALKEKLGKAGGTDEDPYFYFYENFLAAYDADLREKARRLLHAASGGKIYCPCNG